VLNSLQPADNRVTRCLDELDWKCVTQQSAHRVERQMNRHLKIATQVAATVIAIPSGAVIAAIAV